MVRQDHGASHLRRPTTVPESQTERADKRIEEFGNQVDRQVEAILDGVEQPLVESQLESLVFTANNLLPKRNVRPTYRFPHVATELYLSYDPDAHRLDEFVQFVVLFLEYYDIVDDIFDGDVAEGTEAEVFVTHEALQPLLVRHVHQLGEDAVSYWTDHAVRMIQCFLDELRHQPSAEVYLEVLDEQAELIGIITGLAAVVAGEDPETVERAETFGKHYFKYDQFLLDCKQYTSDDPDPWNARQLLSDRELIEQLSEWQTEMQAFLDESSTERAENLRPLVALDLETWLDQYE